MSINHLIEKFEEIPPRRQKQLLYPTDKILTPFGKKQVIYADFIASGRPSPAIEKYIIKNVYSKYSNTHSNAANGICMKNEIEKVKEIIKAEYNVDDKYEVLFKGSGTTGAINYLINCLDYSQYKDVYVFISFYEHFSNHITWVELAKENKNIKLLIIPLNRKNEIDLSWYDAEVKKIYGRRGRCRGRTLIITSIIHCSNVTGYFTPIEDIKKIMDKYGDEKTCKFLFSDLACSAPYSKIDCSIFDAFFVSPHKFIGGVETPGILVAKTCLFQKDHSLNPGGSCVKKTHYNEIVYSDDIEVRENAGTPNIVGIIKIGQCILLKQQLQELISYNEKILVKIMKKRAANFKKKYANFRMIEYDDDTRQLPIFSFHLTNLHYNFIVVLLNDLAAIQTRGGRACSGLFNDYIKDKYGFDGFCRVSLHWSMTKKNILFIFSMIEFIIKNGEHFSHLYKYDEKANLFYCKGAPAGAIKSP